MRILRIVNLFVILSLFAIWPIVSAPPVAAQTSYDCNASTGIPQAECEALVALYNATDGANWSDSTNWLATTTPCDWFGVTCSYGNVTRISLPNNQLSGNIPPQIGNLSGLQYLYLYGNHLSGSIPPELGRLSALEGINLGGNHLSGNIPPELGKLSNLLWLLMEWNQLSGNIPPELGNLHSLTWLLLHKNSLGGEIPPELGALSRLEDLNLGRNQLRGNIPPEIGNLSALQSLELANNQLGGNIPSEFGKLATLEDLRLENNQLSGPIPSSMASLTSLDTFSFYLTSLCLPSDGPVKTWLDNVGEVSGTTGICEQQPGSLGGVVRSPDSKPLAGIQVDLYRRMSSGNFRYMTTMRTGASGMYRYYNLLENSDYTLRFRDPAGAYASEYYDDAPILSRATFVTAVNGMWRSDVDAVLARSEVGANVYLPLVDSSPSHVDWTLTPYDANSIYPSGPSRVLYGHIPEIIASSSGRTLDVLAQDYDSDTPWKAVLLHIEPGPDGYMVTQALTDFPMLDRVMGLATDSAGNRYYATGVEEYDVVDPYYPPLDTYRSNIVRVVKLSPAGNVLFNIDLDIARHAAYEDAEMIINPMTASTSRLAVGGNEVALVHGINTDPDWSINGQRHQKALSTRLNADSGTIRRVSSIWVSHSFDQRLFYDGDDITEYHLGDAYPRSIPFGRNHVSYSIFHIKGEHGDNNTFTRLGNIGLIKNDPQYRYIALFVTESSADLPSDGSHIAGPRNLAIVRIKDSDNSIDPNLPDVLTVDSQGTIMTNRLRWLTHYTAASNLHAERPKLVGIGGDRYVILWEEWHHDGDWTDTFNGVYGMVIDGEGNVLRAAKLLTNQYHLHWGDDAFLLDNRAAWMTGSESDKSLQIHLVNGNLNYQMVTVK